MIQVTVICIARKERTPRNISSSVPECINYKTITDSWRAITSRSSDHANNYMCDLTTLKEGWYRFDGAAGNYLPTSATGSNPSNRVCGTQIVAWIRGKHPLVTDLLASCEWNGQVLFLF